ncbi:uncharacterized protein LOC128195389 [Vigna angularis]|uniref:uncharacterized protein LOC128195389 n=1 Tax=Phaseolus angularis TaxID=3914 RepID=UPI0022B3838B|nr:uncharacterized protein LOC128195389 [Vigna angularis]
MPNVESLRNRCLSAIAERFRGFKTKLTSRYIFGPKSNENPCSKYSAIDEETWRQFVELRSSEAWQEKRSKAQGISAQNKNPHLLSRGGYRKLEEKIMKQKSDSRLPLSEGDDPLPPPSPPSRHDKWKLARMRPSGSYTSESAREISERIDSLVEQSSQGRSGKGSCSAAGAPGDDMDDTRPCELYILSDTGTMLVARGTVYETATVVHGVQLAEDEVKVTVDEVVIADVVLPVPTDEFFTVEEAFRSFVAWPRHLVGHVSNPPQIGQEGSPRPKKTHLSEDDPLGALDDLAKLISEVPMNNNKMILSSSIKIQEKPIQAKLYSLLETVLNETSAKTSFSVVAYAFLLSLPSNQFVFLQRTPAKRKTSV